MIKWILIILMPFLFCACKETIPSGIIKPQKMQEILWDVLRVDAFSHELVKKDSAKVLADEQAKLTKKIFLIHNISEEQFQKSYSYYTQHPDKMKMILDSLNAQQIRKSTIEVSLKRNQIKKDSSQPIYTR